MAKKQFLNLIQRGEQAVKNQIVVWPEFESLIPPLKPEEFEQLEASLIAEGCREPLIVWNHGGQHILIDGHNRYRICQKHGLEYRVQVRDFDDPESVRTWMVKLQLGRRNLTPEQQSYLRGLRYLTEKQTHGGSRSPDSSRGSLAQHLAREFKVGEKTIRRDAEYALGIERLGQLNPLFKHQVISGDHSLTKSMVQELGQAPAERLDNRHFSSLEEVVALLTKASAPAEPPEAEAPPRRQQQRSTSGSRLPPEVVSLVRAWWNSEPEAGADAAFWEKLQTLRRSDP
jgi:hypothetical protein